MFLSGKNGFVECESVLGKEGLVFDSFLIENFLRIFVSFEMIVWRWIECDGWKRWKSENFL